MSKKIWPILYSNFLYKMGLDFLEIQYHTIYKKSCPILYGYYVYKMGQDFLDK